MDILAEGWTWLGTNSKQIGALSSIVFGISTAVVAWAALRINYRNNFGWAPVIISSTALSDFAETGDSVRLMLQIEVLNRRRYPIRLDWLWLTFKNERAPFNNHSAGWHWMRGGSEFAIEVKNGLIDPNGSYRTSFEATFVATTLEEFYDTIIVEARFYDLRSDKELRAYKNHRADVRHIVKPLTIPPVAA